MIFFLSSRTPILSVAALTAALAACSTTTTTNDAGTTTDRPAAIAKLTGDATKGKVVYETTSQPTCLSCHKADGTGGPGSGYTIPGLAEPAKNDPVDEIATVIVNGKGAMPKQSSLSDQDIADVVAYMKATFK